MRVRRHSLRRRVIAALVAAVLATSAIFGLATFIFAYTLEDRLFSNALDGEIAAALEAGEIKQKIGQFKEKLTDWDGQMSAAGISPGGCADLLAMALLMAFCERDAAEA